MPRDKAQAAAKAVVMLVLDVDGVFTDGGLYYDAKGGITKRFNVQDGLGVKLAQAAGLEVAVATGLDSEAVRLRIRELGIKEYFAGHLDKGDIVREISTRRGIPLEHMAYLGDDWVDVSALKLVGLPMAVPNARREILELAAWVTERPGGHGAARDAIDFILQARGLSEALWKRWGG